MVSTLDFESSDPSSNLGGTLLREDHFLYSKNTCKMVILGIKHRQSSSNWTIFSKIGCLEYGGKKVSTRVHLLTLF